MDTKTVVLYQYRGKKFTPERMGKIAETLADFLAWTKTNGVKVWSVSTEENFFHESYHKVVISKK